MSHSAHTSFLTLSCQFDPLSGGAKMEIGIKRPSPRPSMVQKPVVRGPIVQKPIPFSKSPQKESRHNRCLYIASSRVCGSAASMNPWSIHCGAPFFGVTEMVSYYAFFEVNRSIVSSTFLYLAQVTWFRKHLDLWNVLRSVRSLSLVNEKVNWLLNIPTKKD